MFAPLLFYRRDTKPVRVVGIITAAKGAAPVEAHFAKRLRSGHTLPRPLAIAEHHQRLTQFVDIDARHAGAFFLLMMGIGKTGGKKFGADFRDGHIHHAAAGL